MEFSDSANDFGRGNERVGTDNVDHSDNNDDGDEEVAVRKNLQPSLERAQ